MKVLILYDNNGFNTDDENVMNAIGHISEIRPVNIYLSFGMRQERGRLIPTLYFCSQDDEHDFFDTVKSQNEVRAFVSMPQNLLANFSNQVFQDKRKLYKITCILNNVPIEASMYGNRWVTFRYYTEAPLELNLHTSVEYNDKIDDKIYEAYLNPLILDIDEGGVKTVYENFFVQRNRLPFALPLSITSEKKDYFGAFKNNTKLTLRSSIRDFIKLKHTDKNNCLFFLLWEMTDNFVYTEFLKEGAYFTLNSYDNSVLADTGHSGGIENNGKMQIKFNLPITDKAISKWRIKLLQQDVLLHNSHGINKIKEAIRDDVKRGLVGLNSDLAFEQPPLINNWGVVNSRSFDNIYPRTFDGLWQSIQELLQEWIKNGILSSNDIKEFIETEVLNPSAGLGESIPPDHILALELLCDSICKFPFGNIFYFSKSNRKDYLKKCDKVWQKFVIDFFRDVIDRNINDLGKITTESNIITYHENLSMEEVFYLRLAKKANDHIKSLFTSILDYPNALDANFII